MELILRRSYFPNGTNGVLLNDGVVLCYTIELPWKNNAHTISCIPEGRYPVVKRYSDKFGWHFEIMHVPDRALILIHPANDALKELEGCIAPVTTLTGEGKGDNSRAMLLKLKTLLYPALDVGTPVFINIQKNVL